MIDILVFNTGNLLGTMKVPNPDEGELICLYKKWHHPTEGVINILYFSDMDYGIVISDESANYFDELEERI